MSYQPLWVDGQTIGESKRDAAGRYEMIRTCLESLSLAQPGFTLLDVGAQSGYFSVRFADEMGAKAVAVDGAPELAQAMKRMDFTNVTTVSGFLQPGDLRLFSQRDVGLCLSVLHHVDWWEEMLDELRSVCRVVFVECAMNGEVIGKPYELLDQQYDTVRSIPGARLIGTTPGFDRRIPRPMFQVPGKAFQ